MAETRSYSDRKILYFKTLTHLMTTYKTCILVNADNVGSYQLQKVRMLLRNKPHQGFILMGKNTMARNCIRKAAAENPKLEKLIPLCVGNVGFVFTNDDAKAVRDAVLSIVTPASAKAGGLAPSDVYVPAGPTGLDPSQTAFFQSLNIATKIVKGAIEIVNQVHLLKPGDKVGNSEVSLLSKLNIRPFTYALKIVSIYDDGAIYGSSVLDNTAEALTAKFMAGVSKLAAISLGINYPSLAALPHLVSGAYQKLLAVSLATEYTFEQAQKFKDFLKNPGAFAAATTTTASSSSAPAAAAVKEEPKEEEEVDMGFSLFD